MCLKPFPFNVPCFQAFSGHGLTEAAFAAQIRTLMIVVLGFSVATLAMYAYIDRLTMQKLEDDKQRRQVVRREARRQRQRDEDEEQELLRLERQLSNTYATSSLSDDVSSGDEAAPEPTAAAQEPAAPLEEPKKASLGEIYRQGRWCE